MKTDQQSELERRLVRCRYLITRGAVERLGLRDLDAIAANRPAFMRECHTVFKKAQQILMSTILELEDEIGDLPKTEKQSTKENRLRYWVRIFESSYEAFLWLHFGPSDIPKIYKCAKYGCLGAQNIESAVKATRHLNENPDAFAIPLDFTRFSCIADLLKIELRGEKKHVDWIELKEGRVNEEMLDAFKSANSDTWLQFLNSFGEKGVEQVQRFVRAGKELDRRSAQIKSRPGTHKDEHGLRIVAESRVKPEFFTDKVERLCEAARRGDYAVEIMDGCLAVAALDATSRHRSLIAEFDARLLALNAFLSSDDTSSYPPERLVAELDKVEFLDWTHGLGSVGLMPLLLRPLETRWFLDLLFGRIRLLLYFDAPGFMATCKDAGLNVGFLSKKHTNRLRSRGGWRAGDYPLHEGRALAYMVDKHPMIIGSLRLHQMAFNWQRPSSVAAEIADCVGQVEQPGGPWDLSDLGEADLERPDPKSSK